MDKYRDVIAGSLVALFFIGVPTAGLFYFATSDTPTQTQSSQTLTAEESDYVANNGTSECTSDCSGHDAGYEWAEENDICDPNYDNGNSDSFNEGVQEYAYDNCYYGDGNESF